ncbi:hypothetical protein LSG31_09030 [Fodinisporobacter ferrooxydans]|uniref:Uncharacterized protein n=1 Tax=Fodinisporobacter ferrooxydans TaxID=2901836 RepID=A0ABY4CN93_9BACL|nr:hypothetical protein LSG31_01130 [Alicyclobacillaceae bacterium MYW30-H2]UOF92284.1 hypothetical protein LSG31_09030 [Alicyclobacillaceae bacterium MYW30-H2]
MEENQSLSHIISRSQVNEVRNSLLAIRLLLFQHSKIHLVQDELKIVEDELLRLELLLASLLKSDGHKEPSG